MQPTDSDLYRRTKRAILYGQGKLVALVVLVLSLVAWWKQNFISALMGGVALYLFLMFIIICSSFLEERSRGKAAEDEDEHDNKS